MLAKLASTNSFPNTASVNKVKTSSILWACGQLTSNSQRKIPTITSTATVRCKRGNNVHAEIHFLSTVCPLLTIFYSHVSTAATHLLVKSHESKHCESVNYPALVQ